MRSTGHARSPMVATLVTVLLNTSLGYCLRLRRGAASRSSAVAGAGWSTLLTAVAQGRRSCWPRCSCSTGWWPGSCPGVGSRGARVLVPLFVLALPLGITELFWTTGTFLYNVVFQQIGDDALAAAQIVNTLEGLFLVGSIGLMAATTALVGRAVGRGDAGRRGVGAPDQAGGWSPASGSACSSAPRPGPPFLFHDTAGASAGAWPRRDRHLCRVQVVKVRNMILGAGVLPSAGDVRGVILGDVMGAFVVGLPLAIVLGLHTPLGVAGVFVARVIEEVAKVVIFTWRSRRVDWHGLARTGSARAAV